MRKVRSEAAADRIRYAREHDRNCPRLAGKGGGYGRGHTEDRIGPQIDQFFCHSPDPIRIIGAPAKFDPEIAAFSPPQLRKRIPESCEPRLRSPIALRVGHQHADQPHPVRLLRARRERPCGRAAEKRDELPPSSYKLDPKTLWNQRPASFVSSIQVRSAHGNSLDHLV